MYELHRIRLIADAQPEHAGAAADLVLALIDGSPTGRLLGRARDHGAEMLALGGWWLSSWRAPRGEQLNRCS